MGLEVEIDSKQWAPAIEHVVRKLLPWADPAGRNGRFAPHPAPGLLDEGAADPPDL